MLVSKKHIIEVARRLKVNAYESSYAGKDRGRFIVSREDLKRLLGVHRLHPFAVQRLIDACLAEGLIVIDMDDSFAFAETIFIEKWRKLPSRFVTEYVNEMFPDDDLDDDVVNGSDDSENEN
jgi:hypothetical protein